MRPCLLYWPANHRLYQHNRWHENGLSRLRSQSLKVLDNAMLLVILLFITQFIFSLVIWKKWKGTREKLASVHHELSSLQGIVDVSREICPIMDGKAITGASVVARDITERKRAAGSLAQQAAAMKASMDGMAIIDHHGMCSYLNDA